MSSEELSYWIAFSEIEPFGEMNAFWRSGLITAMIFNTNRDPKKSQAAKPEDFMPINKSKPRVMSPDEQLAYIRRVHEKFTKPNLSYMVPK